MRRNSWPKEEAPKLRMGVRKPVLPSTRFSMELISQESSQKATGKSESWRNSKEIDHMRRAEYPGARAALGSRALPGNDHVQFIKALANRGPCFRPGKRDVWVRPSAKQSAQRGTPLIL